MIKILFLAIFLMALWVPAFNRVAPSLFGIPFFYWYQMSIVLISSFLIWIVFKIEEKKEIQK